MERGAPTSTSERLGIVHWRIAASSLKESSRGTETSTAVTGLYTRRHGGSDLGQDFP